MIDVFSSDCSIMTNQHGCPPYASAPMYTGREVDGDLRLNHGTFEVFSGGHWISISGSVDVQLPHETQEVLKWAKAKMDEEKQLAELCEKYPALKSAKDKYEVIKAMVIHDK